MEKVDSVILAGDKKGSKPILGVNKVYLEIENKPIVIHTLDSMLQSERINTVYLVGNVEKLKDTLLQHGHEKELASGKVQVVEQGNTLIENIWRCFLVSIDGELTETNKKISENEDKKLLILTGDSPLVTVDEIDYFLEKANMDRFDYVIGLTDIENLKKFYPNKKRGLPGITMAPLNFKEKLYRINNLHLARPAKIKNREYINRIYQYRYLKEWRNMVSLMWEMKKLHLQKGDFTAFLVMEIALLARKYHFYRIAQFFRQYAPIQRIERILSNILHAEFGYQETLHGGATIDVDNERDYQIIKRRWREWMVKLAKQQNRV